MGIDGLLKLLTPITQKQHISSFSNSTVAVDIMSWIYKGCYRCAFELNQKIESNNYLYYIFEMIDLLAYYRIKPICVFDGRYVGRKNATIEKRKKSKEENKEKGLRCLQEGRYEEARKYLSRCIIIDQRIIATIMRAFHTKKVEFMVAPYESDSQIAKLCNLKIVDFAISEDSDLIIYGLKVIMKLNQDGECDLVDLSRWRPEDVDGVFLKQFLKMGHEERIESAVLSGTDYNSSIKGIGIKKAIKHLSKYRTSKAVVDHLKEVKPFSEKIPENYDSTILQAKLIFLLATVYNPITKVLEPLNPSKLKDLMPEGMTEEELKKITGVEYGFDEDVAVGRINAKNLEIRDIHKIDIKTVFKLDVSSLAIREEANRQRRYFLSSAKKRRENEREVIGERSQRIESYQIDERDDLKEEERKKMEEEKKRLILEDKLDRVKKFNEFRSLLDTFSDFDSDSEEEKESDYDFQQEKPKNSQGITQSKVKKVAEYFSKLSDSQSEKDDSQISSAQANQQNPWAKDKASSSKKTFR